MNSQKSVLKVQHSKVKIEMRQHLEDKNENDIR